MEWYMHQFIYVHIILRSPLVDAPISIIRRDFDDLLADYESHLILENYQSMLATHKWYYVDGYMHDTKRF